MLNLLFNTLLTITLHNTQKRRRRKERTTYGPLTRYSRLVTRPVRYQTEVREGYRKIHISIELKSYSAVLQSFGIK